MKLTPPTTYQPRSDLERAIYEAIVQLVGGEVFNLETLEASLAHSTQPCESFNGFDYIARTGVRWLFNGLARAGETIGVKCGEVVSVEVLERWMT